MRLSHSFGKTLRDAPADAEMASHQLLIRANFIRPIGAGIYAYMPFGYRVIRRLSRVLSEEMDAIGGQEMAMPNLHPAAIWQATGRWDQFDVLMRVKAGRDREYALSPTHEEIVNELTLREIDSYRDLPQFIYHISRKFRDEPRPRGGLIRLREFLMKDAYSLDTGDEALDAFYPSIIQAYRNIFERCDVPAVLIRADVGAMGGKTSHEFTVPHPAGEDVYIACTACDYAANVDAAEFLREGEAPTTLAALEKLATPDCKTIADVAAFVGVPVRQTIKVVFYWATPSGQAETTGRVVFALVRGDLDVNEIKLSNALGGSVLRAAAEAEIEAAGAVPGYASPVGLDVAATPAGSGILVVSDPSIRLGGNFVVGANEAGYHFTGANFPRDIATTLMADIATAETGHRCPTCGEPMEARRAIEVGHCFKLGTRYSEAVNAVYLDEDNQPQFITMGSYGIGLDRLMAVIAELHHDDDGLIWPPEVAPFQVHLLSLGKGDDVKEAAEGLYRALSEAGIDTLYDDRDVSAGVKFKDADLIGVPLRLAVGSRGLGEGTVELKRRARQEREPIPLDSVVAVLGELIAGR